MQAYRLTKLTNISMHFQVRTPSLSSPHRLLPLQISAGSSSIAPSAHLTAFLGRLLQGIACEYHRCTQDTSNFRSPGLVPRPGPGKPRPAGISLWKQSFTSAQPRGCVCLPFAAGFKLQSQTILQSQTTYKG